MVNAALQLKALPTSAVAHDIYSKVAIVWIQLQHFLIFLSAIFFQLVPVHKICALQNLAQCLFTVSTAMNCRKQRSIIFKSKTA